MKVLFFIVALAGAVYLIIQTPAGEAWLRQSEPELNSQQKSLQKSLQVSDPVEKISTQVVESIENKVTELAKRLNQKQQAQIKQLENRMAELENELVMSRIAEKQQRQVKQDVFNEGATLDVYKESEEPFITPSSKQGLKITTQKLDKLTIFSDSQLQRKRQARLQDIAEKMEVSSLQALVN